MLKHNSQALAINATSQFIYWWIKLQFSLPSFFTNSNPLLFLAEFLEFLRLGQHSIISSQPVSWLLVTDSTFSLQIKSIKPQKSIWLLNLLYLEDSADSIGGFLFVLFLAQELQICKCVKIVMNLLWSSNRWRWHGTEMMAFMNLLIEDLLLL